MEQETHEQELKDLYNKLPKAYSNTASTTDIRLINYPLFESILSELTAKAFYQGQISAVEDVEDIIQTTFK